ncbi:MAG: helix-turn-helix transcriptional regulator [Phycisphaerae bacterium]
MSAATKLTKLKRHEDQRHGALSAVVALVQMDPHARADLIVYLKALNEAQAAKDVQEQEYLLKAILEIMEVDGPEDGPDLAGWEAEAKATVAGRRAAQELAGETQRFFAVYQRLKAQSGLDTIRKVARAAGLSPTTVQAIEKQRVKPQFRTLQALAKGFKVDAGVLNR